MSAVPFRKANFNAVVNYNSAFSSRLLDIYKAQSNEDVRNESARSRSCTFSPSGMRCLRKQWFRLRGVETDIIENPDLGLDFRAKVGTDRHVAIQTRLKKALGKDWISVKDYLEESGIDLDCEITENGMESLVTVKNPPIKFAVDGIIRIDGRIFLLEIKTCDYSSFEHLTQQKSVHEDQVTLYSAILGIRDVLFLYEDRQNGNMKSYQYTVKESAVAEAKSKMQLVMDMAEKGIAPDRLPKSDYLCSNCEYAKKCCDW